VTTPVEGRIKLLIDEDMWQGMAAHLREAGYDAVSVTELGRKGLDDDEQMAFAIAEGRAIMTHNAKHFAPMAEDCFLKGVAHHGILIAPKLEKGELLRRTLALLESLAPESLANTLRFV
jgi:uncharacterized protein with PIN domain